MHGIMKGKRQPFLLLREQTSATGSLKAAGAESTASRRVSVKLHSAVTDLKKAENIHAKPLLISVLAHKDPLM